MNLPDFVFEHFLNLEDIIAHFEEKEEAEEGEKPHLPSAQAQVHSQQVVTAPKIAVWISKEYFITIAATIIYPLLDDCCIPSPYLPGLFRPPICS